MKNSLYQKIHRMAMKIIHAVYRPFKKRSKENEAGNKTASAFGSDLPYAPADNGQKPITNQGKYKHLKYGKSSIGDTGCIPIAIYNVMLLGNREEGPDFGEIVERVKALKAPLFGGRMGTDPYMIDEILRGYGIETEEITNKKDLAREMAEAEKGTLFLITQWNDMRRPLKGIHAYVVEKHADDRWACYNLVYRDYPTRAANLAEMLGRGRLIVANRIKL